MNNFSMQGSSFNMMIDDTMPPPTLPYLPAILLNDACLFHDPVGSSDLYPPPSGGHFFGGASLHDNLSSFTPYGGVGGLFQSLPSEGYDAKFNVQFQNRFGSSYGHHLPELSSSSFYYGCYGAPAGELALSLGVQKSSYVESVNVHDQCSEEGCSGLTQVNGNNDHLQNSHLLLQPYQDPGTASGSFINANVHFHAAAEWTPLNSSTSSKLRLIAEEILADVACRVLAGLDKVVEAESTYKMVHGGESLPLVLAGETAASEEQCKETSMQRTELLNLLYSIDSRYERCLDEIQKVNAKFDGASAPFASHGVSDLYTSLRKRITEMLVMNSQPASAMIAADKERNWKSSFLRKQWALQQLKKGDSSQSWRPQRGLPDKSVSVLRAWMFDNFLRPYPKDAEKDQLAMKSGLTRSQVSNWFINARVRLWKPMIEEMYAELNKEVHSSNMSVGEVRIGSTGGVGGYML